MEESSEEESQEYLTMANTVGIKIYNTIIIFFIKATLIMHQCDRLGKCTVGILLDSSVCVIPHALFCQCLKQSTQGVNFPLFINLK